MSSADGMHDDACVYKSGRAEHIGKTYFQHTNDSVFVGLGQTLERVGANFIPEQFLVEAERSLREKVHPSYDHSCPGKLELIVLGAKQLKEAFSRLIPQW